MASRSESYGELLNPSIVKDAKISGKRQITLPAGFNSDLISLQHNKSNATVRSNNKPDLERLEELKVKKAWEIALGPAKTIPMNLIMSYMTGNSLQIIPIMMTLMLFWNPLKAIFTETNANFKSLETKKNASDILLTRTVFVVCQLACMAVGIWKLYNMGLIPNSESDWLAWKEAVQYKESVLLI
ncbi:uncharacterized protein AC631_04749 [Debaryomyces fabryi]|uniref:ER membrane protein complex subunit 4 n=1 Tax=Debaryomyces fabryi TaxID=58627 RepID=A0A0V1PTD4_9ASCO|nr:uncharacterized protein AC631_04749 [Debaryomyces fabryi]KRZ99498.1 hypothetical protein AC631_04749 [Debaryomyces fabryi]CUM54113.1 unnamed protein product [Debaryomyces fabryi]